MVDLSPHDQKQSTFWDAEFRRVVVAAQNARTTSVADIWGQKPSPNVALLFKALKIARGEDDSSEGVYKIAELGCGAYPRDTFEIIKNKAHNVVAIDISLCAVDMAQEAYFHIKYDVQRNEKPKGAADFLFGTFKSALSRHANGRLFHGITSHRMWHLLDAAGRAETLETAEMRLKDKGIIVVSGRTMGSYYDQQLQAGNMRWKDGEEQVTLEYTGLDNVHKQGHAVTLCREQQMRDEFQKAGFEVLFAGYGAEEERGPGSPHTPLIHMVARKDDRHIMPGKTRTCASEISSALYNSRILRVPALT